MLPSDLLAVSRRKGEIWPRYARLSEENLELARSLIDAYAGHVGEKKNILKEFVADLEGRGFEYRFVRGLAFLLDKKGAFRCDDKIDPVALRRKIFQASVKLGLPLSTDQRSRVIEAAAKELHVSALEIEDSLYADLDSELVLERFEPLPPVELLEEYNLSLTQTLLFDSTELDFTAVGNWQRIFRAVKRLGLIYDVRKNGSFWVKIDGPASFFKLTRRYGTAIAKLLPVVVSSQEWKVEAKILWKYTNEICQFRIESWKHKSLFKKPQVPTVSYDSAVEEDFASRFQALGSGWVLKREPEPIVAGKQVIIPDFSLEKDGVKIYLEIVGFWTPEYLLRKIEKMKKIDVKMLVLVDKNLACQKLTDLAKSTRLDVMYYKDKIPLAPILHCLDDAYQETEAKQTRFVKDLPMVFTEPIVDYREVAAGIGVSVEAVKSVLTQNPPQDYVAMPKGLVRKNKLEEIARKIEDAMDETRRLTLVEAARIIELEGVEDATGILETLGYKIVWHGISADDTEVVKS